MTRGELERARLRADDIGRMGEELIDAFLGTQRDAGAIEEYEWVSNDNAIAPYDFSIKRSERRNVDVKSTCGDFSQVLHVSMSELIEMQGDVAYDIYRVYELNDYCAKLRIAENVKPFAERVLACLSTLPEGVTSDGVSVRPNVMQFGAEIVINLTPSEEENSGATSNTEE